VWGICWGHWCGRRSYPFSVALRGGNPPHSGYTPQSGDVSCGSPPLSHSGRRLPGGDRVRRGSLSGVHPFCYPSAYRASVLCLSSMWCCPHVVLPSPSLVLVREAHKSTRLWQGYCTQYSGVWDLGVGSRSPWTLGVQVVSFFFAGMGSRGLALPCVYARASARRLGRNARAGMSVSCLVGSTSSSRPIASFLPTHPLPPP
jgi:hypothetical protein